MPTIGNNQFPYPNTSDEPNIPGDLQKLALAVDTAIGGGNRLIDTLATLQAIPNTQLFEGMRATVTNDSTTGNNGEYVYTGGAWVSQTHIEEMFTPGQWASDYTIVKRASIAGRTVILDLKITRVKPAWTTDGWASAEILRIPAALAPRVSDFTVPAAGNFSEGPTAVGFTIGPSSISVRPIVHCTISPGSFISASICWDF